MDTFLYYAAVTGLVYVGTLAFTYVYLELRGLLRDADARLTAAIDDVLGPIGVDTP